MCSIVTGVIPAFGALGPVAEPRTAARGRGPGALPARPHVVSQCSVGRGVCRLEGPRGLHVRDKGPAPSPMTWAALKGSSGCHPLSQAGLWMSVQPGLYAPAWGLRTSLPGLLFLNSVLSLFSGVGVGGWAKPRDLSLRRWWGISTEEIRIRRRAPPRGHYGRVRGASFFMGRGPKPTPSWEGPRVD